MKKIFINASNIHSGGGKVLLENLLSGINSSEFNIILYLDKRCRDLNIGDKIVSIKMVPKNIIKRISVDFEIRKNLREGDVVIYFGNVPPLLKLKDVNSFLYLQNRLIIDKELWRILELRLRFRLFLERIILKLFKNNISQILVQTEEMRRLCIDFGIEPFRLSVWPFRNKVALNNKVIREAQTSRKCDSKFIYIASNEKYKNHLNLIRAWEILESQGINFQLTLDCSREFIEKELGREVRSANIRFVIIQRHEEVITELKKHDVLIFPSLVESFGLPLLEAKDLGLDIIASELSYVRDVCEPIVTFNPYEPTSISHAVKRYVGLSGHKGIMNSREFFEKIKNFRQKRKRVLINGISARKGGGVVYFQKLIEEEYHPNAVDFYLLVNQDSVHKYNYQRRHKVIVPTFASKTLVFRLLWENIYLPIYLWKEGIDLILCPSGIAPLLLPSKTKIVSVSQNMLLFEPEQLKKFGKLGQLKFWLIRNLQLNTFKRSDLVIFISKYAKEKISTLTKVRKSVVIYHGVDDYFRFEPNTRGSFENYGNYAVYVSHFYAYKSHLELLGAWKKTRDLFSHNYKLLLAGDDSTPYGREVKAVAKKLGLNENVIFLGEISHRKISELYSTAKLIIFASQCENCPNILIEAINSDVPTICSSIEPMPEIAGENVDYFDPRDEKSFSESLNRFFMDDGKILLKSVQERKNWARQYSWPSSMKKTWSSIEDLW